jgi:microcystin-dependent protein
MTTTINGSIGDLEGVVNRAGELFDFAGSSAPSYALALPLVATNISRTTYAELFAAIGTTWGAGDGSTTFGMPYCPADYALVQSNGNVGTTTVGENLAHTHTDAINSYAVPQTSPTVNVLSPQSAGSPLTVTSNSSGGAANLAAGMRVLKCVRIR